MAARPRRDLPLRPDPEGHAIQQRGGIPGIGQDCPQHFTGQVGSRGFVPGILVDGLTEQLPEGQRLKFVVGRADDLQPVIMGLDIP